MERRGGSITFYLDYQSLGLMTLLLLFLRPRLVEVVFGAAPAQFGTNFFGTDDLLEVF